MRKLKLWFNGALSITQEWGSGTMTDFDHMDKSTRRILDTSLLVVMVGVLALLVVVSFGPGGWLEGLLR